MTSRDKVPLLGAESVTLRRPFNEANLTIFASPSARLYVPDLPILFAIHLVSYNNNHKLRRRQRPCIGQPPRKRFKRCSLGYVKYEQTCTGPSIVASSDRPLQATSKKCVLSNDFMDAHLKRSCPAVSQSCISGVTMIASAQGCDSPAT